jgi:hypothetical protein
MNDENMTASIVPYDFGDGDDGIEMVASPPAATVRAQFMRFVKGNSISTLKFCARLSRPPQSKVRPSMVSANCAQRCKTPSSIASALSSLKPSPAAVTAPAPNPTMLSAAPSQGSGLFRRCKEVRNE